MESLFFHPKLVHLPIALAILMPLIAGALVLAWWRRWLPARAWFAAVALQGLLVGSGFMAMRSGEADEEQVERVVPEAALEAHEEAAEVFVWGSVGVLAVMVLAGVLAARPAASGIAAAAVAGTLIVLVLGYRVGAAGGDLVYRHGAAQVYAGAGAAGTGAPGVAPAARGDDDDD